jgi:peptidoglycan DL-endopeptidase CwlO
VQARSAMQKSTLRQQDLTKKITAAQAQRKALEPEVNAIAAQQYTTGDIGTVSFLLGSHGSDDFLRKAVSLEEINAMHDHKLAELNRAIDTVNLSKAELSAEIKAQQKNLLAMQKQKESADKALSGRAAQFGRRFLARGLQS